MFLNGKYEILRDVGLGWAWWNRCPAFYQKFQISILSQDFLVLIFNIVKVLCHDPDERFQSRETLGLLLADSVNLFAVFSFTNYS